MSYRIAQVRIANSGRTYPVNCHRRDLRQGDVVVVEMPQKQTLKIAELESLEFLNWNCSNTIIGKVSEFQQSEDGQYVINRQVSKGDMLETSSDLLNALHKRGWTYLGCTSKVWQRVYAKSLPKFSGVIAFRTNGIDFQLFDGNVMPGVSGRNITISTGSGIRFVRNWYYDSGVDLFDLTYAFARELECPEPDPEPYFHGIGRKPPRGPMYLCDDIMI